MEDPGLFRESLRAALRPFQDEGTSLSPSAAMGYLRMIRVARESAAQKSSFP